MSGSFKPSKFKYVSDPPVVTKPFGIEVDKDKCIGCSVCVKQCPVQSIEMVPRKEPSPKQQAACQYRCPAGTDIRGYMQLLSQGGSYDDAWRRIVEMNPMPAVTGRVCPHPCEDSCNRCGVDEPLNIHGMERFLGDYAIEKGLSFEKPAKMINEKIAIVGSGPSGMSCAYHLARLGYQVTIYESSSNPGGMLTWAIPRYRLPQSVVDSEIKRIINLGINLKTNITAGKDITFDELKKEYKAVYVAPGAQNSTALGVKGERSGSVYSGLDFLRSVKENKPLKMGGKVVVVGGGNTAIDAARTARRMGSDVTILYRRTIDEMPAHPSEIEAAQQEGVKINFLCAPVQISKDGDSLKVTSQRMKLGEPDSSGRPKPVAITGSEFDLSFDTLIAAVGQDLKAEGFERLLGSPWFKKDAMGSTDEKGVFTGGDAAQGPGLVSEAIGAGRKAAIAIDAFIMGKKAALPEFKEIDFTGVPFPEVKKSDRGEAPEIPVRQRLDQPDLEVGTPLNGMQASAEPKRCLGCGLNEPNFAGLQYFGKICIACHDCQAVCPQEALVFPHFYNVEEGRFAYDFDYPQVGQGFPNPLQLDKPVPLSEIDDKLTGVEKVVYNRRSVRVYKDQPVPKELIKRVIEAGRFAPSAGNCQGWKFVVVTDKELLQGLSDSSLKFLGLFTKLYQGRGLGRTVLKKALAFIKPNSIDQRPMAAIQGSLAPKFGEGIAHCMFHAPAAIFLLKHSLHISEPELGMGILGQNMVLAAHSLGLGTCYVGFVANALNLDPITKAKFGKKLGLEWPYNSVSIVITLGYPAVQVDKPVDREFPKVKWVE
jgi:NADPH-dependent glutamate synthase beta subunit-like oxidoreductase/nitroreductase/NAD-dependent dihydropyrimidine dehydrogenase PreA subunit